jgi:hypothetical protein
MTVNYSISRADPPLSVLRLMRLDRIFERPPLA